MPSRESVVMVSQYTPGDCGDFCGDYQFPRPNTDYDHDAPDRIFSSNLRQVVAIRSKRRKPCIISSGPIRNQQVNGSSPFVGSIFSVFLPLKKDHLDSQIGSRGSIVGALLGVGSGGPLLGNHHDIIWRLAGTPQAETRLCG